MQDNTAMRVLSLGAGWDLDFSIRPGLGLKTSIRMGNLSPWVLLDRPCVGVCSWPRSGGGLLRGSSCRGGRLLL